MLITRSKCAAESVKQFITGDVQASPVIFGFMCFCLLTRILFCGNMWIVLGVVGFACKRATEFDLRTATKKWRSHHCGTNGALFRFH